MTNICMEPGCIGSVTARGLCVNHYQKRRREAPSLFSRKSGRDHWCYTHGQSQHPLYRRWSKMISRCENPNDADFWNYGARGVKVCERWQSFDNFLVDMESSFTVGMTLERTDYTKGYDPENVVWADRTTQGRNTRRVKLGSERVAEMKAVRKSNPRLHTIKRLAAMFGVGYTTAWQALNDETWS